MVKYVYDAWGRHTVTVVDPACEQLANLNPFRYRGYYYDVETGLYFLQTRYYDPETGRFISQDSIEYAEHESINGLNLYAYCSDNPIMYTDPNGTAKWWEWLLGIAVIVLSVAVSVLTAGLATPIAAALGGGLAAAIIGGAVAGAIGGAVVGFGLSVGIQCITQGADNINWRQVGLDTLSGTVSGAIVGGLFGGLEYIAAPSNIASSLSGLNAAQANYDKASFVLQFTPIRITGGVMATDRIAAQLSYNTASAYLGFANSLSRVYESIIKQIFRAARFCLKQIIKLRVKE